jgi:hypothetical protein
VFLLAPAYFYARMAYGIAVIFRHGPKAHGDMRVCLEARVVKDPREFAFGPGVVDQDRS